MRNAKVTVAALNEGTGKPISEVRGIDGFSGDVNPTDAVVLVIYRRTQSGKDEAFVFPKHGKMPVPLDKRVRIIATVTHSEGSVPYSFFVVPSTGLRPKSRVYVMS
jgi:hypothetical protein